MKYRILVLVCVATGTLATGVDGNDADSGTTAPKPEPLLESKKISPERKGYLEATEFAKAGDFGKAMDIAKTLRGKMLDSDPYPDELEGTIYVLKKDYPSAEAAFRRMLEKAPDSRVGKFNLAEVQFLQKKYEEAEALFARVEAAENDRDIAIGDLCRYKRIICLIAGRMNGRADEMLQTQSKTPAGSRRWIEYAQLALAYSKGEPAAANEMLEAMRKKGDLEIEDLYLDSFIELTWGERDTKGKFRFKTE